MNKQIMLSIRPEWAEKILNGEKTIEVRKRAPKLTPPFTVNMYETIGKRKPFKNWENYPEYVCWREDNGEGKMLDYVTKGRGQVVASFVVNKIEELKYDMSEDYFGEVDGDPLFDEDRICKLSCLDEIELSEYLDDGCKTGYAWHISELKVFDKPRKLSDYVNSKKYQEYQKELCEKNMLDKFDNYIVNSMRTMVDYEKAFRIYKAPQSYCYCYYQSL